MSASTVTSTASTPSSANVAALASTAATLGGQLCRVARRPRPLIVAIDAHNAVRRAAPTPRHRATETGRGEIGRRGEELAAARLERLGYEVVERNYRTREGELDLIAVRGGTLVFCEVKALVARTGGRPRARVRRSRRSAGASARRSARIARAWLAERPRSVGLRAPTLRFDAIGVLLSAAGELLRARPRRGRVLALLSLRSRVAGRRSTETSGGGGR